jgi:hypothetical protein
MVCVSTDSISCDILENIRETNSNSHTENGYIFPIPTTGNITLNFKENYNLKEIIISDLTSKKLKRYSTYETIFEIQLDELSSGFYLITIIEEKNIINKKLIIKK